MQVFEERLRLLASARHSGQSTAGNVGVNGQRAELFFDLREDRQVRVRNPASFRRPPASSQPKASLKDRLPAVRAKPMPPALANGVSPYANETGRG